MTLALFDWDPAFLLGLGAMLSGLGGCLTGIAALRAASRKGADEAGAPAGERARTHRRLGFPRGDRT
jgi:hypothetical protein